MSLFIVGGIPRIVCEVKRGDVLMGEVQNEPCCKTARYAVLQHSSPTLYFCEAHCQALKPLLKNTEVVHVV
jgi:hypothetical protein